MSVYSTAYYVHQVAHVFALVHTPHVHVPTRVLSIDGGVGLVE